MELIEMLQNVSQVVLVRPETIVIMLMLMEYIGNVTPVSTLLEFSFHKRKAEFQGMNLLVGLRLLHAKSRLPVIGY
jgi:hypothetical protein